MFPLQLPLSHKRYIILGSVPIPGHVESAANSVSSKGAHLYAFTYILTLISLTNAKYILQLRKP